MYWSIVLVKPLEGIQCGRCGPLLFLHRLERRRNRSDDFPPTPVWQAWRDWVRNL